jgi:hypothetical protein
MRGARWSFSTYRGPRLGRRPGPPRHPKSCLAAREHVQPAGLHVAPPARQLSPSLSVSRVPQRHLLVPVGRSSRGPSAATSARGCRRSSLVGCPAVRTALRQTAAPAAPPAAPPPSGCGRRGVGRPASRGGTSVSGLVWAQHTARGRAPPAPDHPVDHVEGTSAVIVARPGKEATGPHIMYANPRTRNRFGVAPHGQPLVALPPPLRMPQGLAPPTPEPAHRHPWNRPRPPRPATVRLRWLRFDPTLR